MKFNVSLPFDQIDPPEEFLTLEAVAEVGRKLDEAGFYSCSVTDHPCPTSRWLDSGGHYAQDPFVMLGLVASATRKVRLMTGILVLPYRNPFITARAVSSLDAFSNGRVVLGLGAGYLKPEYKALGVDFDSRNDLMDEYMQAMKLAWTGEDFTFEGTGYSAVGNRVRPTPVQKPHPPLLVGGNSKRALRRAVELGDAWHPFIVPKMVTDTARTANISGDDDIVAAIDYMAEHCQKVGRKEPPRVLASSTFHIDPGFSAQEAIDHYAQLKAIGVHGSGASVRAESRGQWCDLARQFGEQVIARMD